MANTRPACARQIPTQALGLSSASFLAARPMSTRRFPVGRPLGLKPCKVVIEPLTGVETQGNEPKLSYEALEQALIQQRLANMNAQRALQQVQAETGQSEAVAKKAVRVCTKGLRRHKEIQSRARLLQTKLDRVAGETDLLQLHDTIDEKEEDLQHVEEEVKIYRSKHWRSEEEKEHEAYLKRRAIAAKWEAEKAAKELQVQQEQDLQWFQSSLDTTKVVGGFLFEMWVKALPLSSPQAAKESRHRGHPKAEDKNRARFL